MTQLARYQPRVNRYLKRTGTTCTIQQQVPTRTPVGEVKPNWANVTGLPSLVNLPCAVVSKRGILPYETRKPDYNINANNIMIYLNDLYGGITAKMQAIVTDVKGNVTTYNILSTSDTDKELVTVLIVEKIT